MFCCTKRQDHYGQVVNSVCLQNQCIINNNQLSCPLCVQEQHQGHSLTTLKKILPELLVCYNQKQQLLFILRSLCDFLVQNFGHQNSKGQSLTLNTCVDRAIQIMIELKNQVQSNNQEIFKMKDIFKNLNKNVNRSSQNHLQASHRIELNIMSNKEKLEILKNLGDTIKIPAKNGFDGSMGLIDTFSHSLKHPYLSLSSDCHTVTKSSHPGHRYSVLTNKSLSSAQNEVNVKIDVSLSGNIMIGLCHETIVKEKDFTNSYGINHGTYLIGQNGNNPQTAISFHHSSNVFNRKEIVGWNFKQGDIVTIGYNFNEHYIYFKLHKGKGGYSQFDMALFSEDYPNKQQILNMVFQQGLRVIVLLQNVGDQVTLKEP